MHVQSVSKKIVDFLSKSLRTDISYIVRNGFWVSFGHVISVVVNLAISILLANFLTKADYGTYKYALSIIGILSVTSLPGISSSITHVIAKGQDGTFLPALYTRIKYGFFGGLMAFVIAFYYWHFKQNNEISLLLCAAALFLPIMDPFGMYGTYLTAKKEFRAVTIYFILNQLFVFLLMIPIIFFTKSTLAIIIAYFGGWTLARYLATRHMLVKYPPSIKEVSLKAISYGKHISISNLIGQIAASLDSLILFNTLGPSLVAINSMAASPAEQIKNSFKNLPTIAVPKLSQRTTEEIDSQLWWRLTLLFCIGLLISFALILMIPILFKLLLVQYTDAIRYAQWYAPTLAFRLPISFLSSISQSKLIYQKKHWIYLSATPNIVLIISLFVLTPLFGITGIIASRYINITSTFFIDLLRWKKYSQMNSDK